MRIMAPMASHTAIETAIAADAHRYSLSRALFE
jgi:hypothetical protein